MESAARNFRASAVHNWPGRDSTDVFTPADYPPRSSAFVFCICLLTNTTKIQGQIEIRTKIQVQIHVQMQKELENHICMESISNFQCFPVSRLPAYQVLKSSIYSCSLTRRLLANLLLPFLSSQLQFRPNLEPILLHGESVERPCRPLFPSSQFVRSPLVQFRCGESVQSNLKVVRTAA